LLALAARISHPELNALQFAQGEDNFILFTIRTGHKTIKIEIIKM